MDILQKYNEENPEMLHQDSPCDPSGEYGALVCTMIRLSAGRIQNVQQADKVLLGIAIVIFILTLFVIVNNFNLLPTGRFSARDAAKQLEEYRKMQPF
jgi:hypothetical protein